MHEFEIRFPISGICTQRHTPFNFLVVISQKQGFRSLGLIQNSMCKLKNPSENFNKIIVKIGLGV